MLNAPILLLALCVAPQEGAGASAWRALPLPSLCRSAPASLPAPRLVRGTHLIVTSDDLESGLPAAAAPALGAAALAGLLGEESRRESWNVTLHPNSPPLLVRGPPAGRQAAEELCSEFDRAGRALEIELQVWLVRGAGAGAAAATQPKDAPWASVRLRSGGEVLLGERAAQSYLHNYSVEVATDAGVAEPVIGQALTGDLLHARAMRVRGGTAVFVEGLLDLSRLTSLEDFELSATDLGSVQHPRVSALQIAFSGCVASGAPLRVAWGGLGSGESLAEGALWIVPRCSTDPTGGRWRLLDTALVEAPAWDLPAVAPGGGLAAAEEAVQDPNLPQPIASALLVKEGDNARSTSLRSRPIFVWGNGVVLGLRSEQEAWAAITDLHGAVEALRTQTSELELTRGAGFVRLPVAQGTRWRVLVCDETTAVIDYDVEIAPETWMPGPRVERRMDGFCVQGDCAIGHSSYSVWSAATPENRVVERSSVPLGRLELQRRIWRSARGELSSGAGSILLLSGPLPIALSQRAL